MPHEDNIAKRDNIPSNEKYTGSPVRRPPSRGETVVEIRNLVKTYRSIEALRGVSLSVRRGEIFGLLGQNGAGKTTMVKALLGIIKITSGDAELLGEPAGYAPTRRRVGYLPEDHRFPDYHTARSLLDFYGTLLEMPGDTLRTRSREMLEFVGLASRQDYKIRTYSKGMKQRLGIAQAVFHNPDVIFLDEPTDGVDPVGRKQIREMLMTMKQEGKTIFINSHLLGEVEMISDRVVILHKGEIIRQGAIADLTSEKGVYLIGLLRGQEMPVEELRNLGFRIQRAGENWEISLKDGQVINPVLDVIRRHNLTTRLIEEKRTNLEDLFIQTVEAVEPV